jgi:hypothetical protein
MAKTVKKANGSKNMKKSPVKRSKTTKVKKKQLFANVSSRFQRLSRVGQMLVFGIVFAAIGGGYYLYQTLASDGLPEGANQVVVSYEIGMSHEIAQDKFAAGMPPAMLLYGNGLMLCSPAVAMPDHTEHTNQLTTNDYTSRTLTRDEVHAFVSTLKANGYDLASEYLRSTDGLMYPASAGRFISVNTTAGATVASLYPNEPSANFVAAENVIKTECAKATTPYDSGKGVAETITLPKDHPEATQATTELPAAVDVDVTPNERKNKEFTGQESKALKDQLGKEAKVYKKGDSVVRARYLTKLPDYEAMKPEKKNTQGKVSAATDMKTRWFIVVGAGQNTPDWATTALATDTANAIKNWYGGKVGKTFEINSVKVLRGSKTPAQYKTCPAGYSCRFPEDAIYFNLQNEFRYAGMSTNIFTTFDNNRCIGLGGPASLAINDNRVGQYNYGFAVTPFSNGSCDWTKGRRFVAAHELGHTFGLAHTCDGTLMSTSGCPSAPEWPYPALNATQASLLRNNSPYFNSFTTTTTTPAPTCPSTMGVGGVLGTGQTLKSPDCGIRLVMQTDGNLVVYSRLGHAIWASGSRGTNARLSLQTDYNLVVRDGAGTAKWASGTKGSGGTQLRVQNDGNVVLYSASGAVWSTHTAGDYNK